MRRLRGSGSLYRAVHCAYCIAAHVYDFDFMSVGMKLSFLRVGNMGRVNPRIR